MSHRSRCANADRPDWIGHGGRSSSRAGSAGCGCAPPVGLGAPPSRYSSVAGSGEGNIFTTIRARARHRGQCSIAIQRAFGLMLRPQRGQFRNGAGRRLAAGSSVLIVNATLSTARGRRTRHPHPTPGESNTGQSMRRRARPSGAAVPPWSRVRLPRLLLSRLGSASPAISHANVLRSSRRDISQYGPLAEPRAGAPVEGRTVRPA